VRRPILVVELPIGEEHLRCFFFPESAADFLKDLTYDVEG